MHLLLVLLTELWCSTYMDALSVFVHCWLLVVFGLFYAADHVVIESPHDCICICHGGRTQAFLLRAVAFILQFCRWFNLQLWPIAHPTAILLLLPLTSLILLEGGLKVIWICTNANVSRIFIVHELLWWLLRNGWERARLVEFEARRVIKVCCCL